MALAPRWVTPAGSLGVVPEGKFYRISLEAVDPDFPNDPSAVSYSLVAGALPAGVQVSTSGTLEGIPVSVADFKGVPAKVSENTISKFVIRAVDIENRIADRTFTLTVSGQDKPIWITPSGTIGMWSDGRRLSYQFLAEDLDPGDSLTISLIAGTLPAGLSIDSSGLLSGFITPLVDFSVSAPPGFEAPGNEYDEYPYDFSLESIDQNHQFTLKLTDGKDVVLRKFAIFIFSRNNMTVDNDGITVDLTTVTVDNFARRSPYLINDVGDIGRYRHDNYFAYRFIGADADNDIIEYYQVDGTLPPGLTLDVDTGWLTGYLEDIGTNEIDYSFGVKVRKAVDPTNESIPYQFTMQVYGEINTSVFWITDAYLGIIDNGSISTLFVEATQPNTEFFYRLLPGGAYSKLPQGLQLMPSGNIIGQVSFKTFGVDGGTTTFDNDYLTRLAIDPTTFDLTYTFVVEAYSLDGLVTGRKEFTILVNKEYDRPYNSVYCKAMPPRQDRALLTSLLTNDSVLPPAAMYRNDDPNFGVATEVVYTHAFGLTPTGVNDYITALEQNHYNKNLVLGEVKTARALDADNNILYEVVYSQVIDTSVNSAGQSVPQSVRIGYPAIDDGNLVTTVYPNSLENMRERLIDQIGQTSKVLPTWMLSKQEDGVIPGFTPAWVIAYTKPGKSKLLQYNIQEFFGTQLNLIDFELDRYTLDLGLADLWDHLTVDLTNITADNTISIDRAGRWTPAVTYVTADSTTLTVDSLVTVDKTEFRPSGISTTFDRIITTETSFDGGSVQFISLVDVYDASDVNDKYVMFPKTHIINNAQ